MFSDYWPIGTVAGCIAGVSLLWLSLIFDRKDIRPAVNVLICQTAGMAIVSLFGNALTQADSNGPAILGFMFPGAAIGAIFGFIWNLKIRKKALER
jgi:hypothetical protein